MNNQQEAKSITPLEGSTVCLVHACSYDLRSRSFLSTLPLHHTAEREPGCLAAQVDAGAGRQELIAFDGQIGRLDG